VTILPASKRLWFLWTGVSSRGFRAATPVHIPPVDSTQGKFKSPALATDQKVQFRFTETEEFPYYCRIHPKMTGSVIVQS